MAAHTSTGLVGSGAGQREFIAGCQGGVWCLELALPVPSGLAPEEQADLILRNGSISDANDAAASMMGAATGNDLVGLPLSGLIDDPRLRDAVIAFVEEGYRLGCLRANTPSLHAPDPHEALALDDAAQGDRDV